MAIIIELLYDPSFTPEVVASIHFAAIFLGLCGMDLTVAQSIAAPEATPRVNQIPIWAASLEPNIVATIEHVVGSTSYYSYQWGGKYIDYDSISLVSYEYDYHRITLNTDLDISLVGRALSVVHEVCHIYLNADGCIECGIVEQLVFYHDGMQRAVGGLR